MHTTRCSTWVLVALLVGTLTLSLPYSHLGAQSSPDPIADTSSSVVRLLEQASTATGSDFWGAVSKIESLGSDAVPVLLSRLPEEGEKGKLACAAAILKVGDDDDSAEAIDAIKGLAQTATSPEVRAPAIELLARHGDIDEALEILGAVLERTLDPAIQIPTARALWELDRVALARDKLVELLVSRDQKVKLQAALTLAEIDYFEGEVRDVLRVHKDEPSTLGRRAASLYKIIQLSRQLDGGIEGSTGPLAGVNASKLLEIKEKRIRELEAEIERSGDAQGSLVTDRPESVVLEEVILQISRSYVDESRTGRKGLIVNALKGMVGGLDEFSAFMDVEETERFRQSLSGEYFGIGAQVHKRPEAPLEIVKPIYGGPAYEMGMLSGDLIVEVESAPTAGLQMDEILERLKGPEATKVKLSVLRRGWSEPREFVVERRKVEVPSVNHELLPGGVGYILLQQFGAKSADEFIAALDDLEKKEVEGLVIDLRNDPGGRLDIAIRIADQFIKGAMPIVTQKGRAESSRDRSGEISSMPDDFTRPNYPIVVLVNERSASASEIVAGALQDFSRATLIGKRTFGKGSVQRLIPLSGEARKYLGGDTQLRLTVQYYFLPLGRCIHTIRDDTGAVVQPGGVEPDIEVDSDKIPIWRLEERERIRTNELVLEYIDKHAEALRKLFIEGDGRDPSSYPELQELYKGLATPGTEEDLRFVLRYHARRKVEDLNGREFACDYQEDVQLQAAILEVLKKLEKKPEDFPRYATFERD